MEPITIAVPASNEESCLGAHLAALDRAAAVTSAKVRVLIFANGCTDATANIAEAFGARHVEVQVREATLPPDRANAGMARRMAANVALELWPDTEILMTSDADSELAPGCLAAVETALGSGADLVCGSISFDLPEDLLAAPTMGRHARIAVPYAALMRELRFGIDLVCGRQAAGPIPHYTASGACMALSRALYDRIGGLPSVPCGEDRALVRRAEAAGARIRYCDRARAIVSPRLIGRAAGGMAETLRRRLEDPDAACDAAFLAADEARRAWRLALAAHRSGRRPVLRDARRPMRVADLERELPRLAAFIAEIVRPQGMHLDHTSSMVA